MERSEQWVWAYLTQALLSVQSIWETLKGQTSRPRRRHHHNQKDDTPSLHDGAVPAVIHLINKYRRSFKCCSTECEHTSRRGCGVTARLFTHSRPGYLPHPARRLWGPTDVICGLWWVQLQGQCTSSGTRHEKRGKGARKLCHRSESSLFELYLTPCIYRSGESPTDVGWTLIVN